ncbi:C2H2-type zinc finger protein [Candidatus Sororendozoicomonas aggregata]|uniref:C2H2-type zinc finger protein n=1 Tax=Candidatus Sororendozoicomonas aggregata TaxID=3073239 RepID=UPI002ED3C8CA
MPKVYPCDQCDKTFPSPTRLKEHKRAHTGVKPFTCNVCQRCFTRLTTLTNHMRTHTGEKPFSCDVCGKRFTTSGNRNSHRRIHTNERSFVCTICNKSFRTKAHLERHQDAHRRGSGRFDCPVCDSKFFRLERTYEKHMSEKHPDYHKPELITSTQQLEGIGPVHSVTHRSVAETTGDVTYVSQVASPVGSAVLTRRETATVTIATVSQDSGASFTLVERLNTADPRIVSTDFDELMEEDLKTLASWRTEPLKF